MFQPYLQILIPFKRKVKQLRMVASFPEYLSKPQVCPLILNL